MQLNAVEILQFIVSKMDGQSPQDREIARRILAALLSEPDSETAERWDSPHKYSPRVVETGKAG